MLLESLVCLAARERQSAKLLVHPAAWAREGSVPCKH